MTALVLVPVKAFGRAKRRLAEVLTPAQRARLARDMAERVLAAAAPLPVAVVCDDDAVAAWARERGAAVVWTPGLDLNGALGAAVERAVDGGYARVVIAHADLPFAEDLARFASDEAAGATVQLVADRHDDGTNVMAFPGAAGLVLGYGPGSFERHRTAAIAAGLSVEVVRDAALAWDVDGPEDLDPPPELGTLPLHAAG